MTQPSIPPMTLRALIAGLVFAIVLCSMNSYLTLSFGVIEEGPTIAALFFFAVFLLSRTKITTTEMVIVSTMGSAGGSLGFISNFYAAKAMTGVPYSLLDMALFGIVSSLIGLLSAGVQSQLDVWRKGRSVVLERDHVVILNWSNSIFDIMKELILAHQHDKRFTIVILANKDKVEMEDEIATKVKAPRNVRIVCRSGDPGDLHDLEIINLEHAGSIVVVAQDEEDADAQNIKVVLALVHGPARREKPYQISAEFRSAKCAQIARAIGNNSISTCRFSRLYIG